MKRRAFLGFLGGAAAAGPTTAAKLATDLASVPISPVPPMGGVYGGLATDDGTWRVARIAELKKLLSGDKSEEEKRQLRINRLHQAEMEERFRLDGLRSPSSSTKARMLIAGNLDRQERVNRLYAEGELERLLKFI